MLVIFLTQEQYDSFIVTQLFPDKEIYIEEFHDLSKDMSQMTEYLTHKLERHEKYASWTSKRDTKNKKIVNIYKEPKQSRIYVITQNP